jgi:histidine triad (HIT) family protein
MSQTCVFCKIVCGEAPGFTVYENDRVLVLMDIFPVTDGHTLVITKEHFEDLFATPPDSLHAVIAAAKRVAHALRAVLNPAGLMVFQLNGAAAFQSVFHYHLHLMPRAADEPLALHTRVPGDPARLRELANALAAAIEAA